MKGQQIQIGKWENLGVLKAAGSKWMQDEQGFHQYISNKGKKTSTNRAFMDEICEHTCGSEN